ncbi:MAG TPA: hypothetical protein GX717_03375, partial [Clostridiaceae bacterium]|nr:hypothetical protein [Clostridiaceae bacterium]
MKRISLSKINYTLLVIMLLLSILLSGCHIFRDTNDLSDTDIYNSPYLKINLLTEMQEKTGAEILSATYTCPVYRYSLQFPGLVRIDDYGLETMGRTTGTLQLMKLDTVAGTIHIYHPQTGYPYYMTSKRPVLNNNGQPLHPVPTRETNESIEMTDIDTPMDVALGEDSIEDSADSTGDIPTSKDTEIFQLANFPDGKALFEQFYTRLDTSAHFGVANLTFFEGDELISQSENYGDYQWYHVAIRDKDGIKQHIFSGIINDIPMIMAVEAGHFEKLYNQFEYLTLADFASEMNDRQLEVLGGILSSLTFHDDLTAVMELKDAGLLTTDVRGGDRLERAENLYITSEETESELNLAESNQNDGHLIINSWRSATHIEGYYTDAIFRQNLPQAGEGKQSQHWPEDPLIYELEQVIINSGKDGLIPAVDQAADLEGESGKADPPVNELANMTTEAFEPFVINHSRLGTMQAQLHIMKPTAFEHQQKINDPLLDPTSSESLDELDELMHETTDYSETTTSARSGWSPYCWSGAKGGLSP